jgi:transitional endoplasmic reticulum ATPase
MHESKVPVLYVKSFHSTSHLPSRLEADSSDWAGDEAGIKAIFERARAEAPCLLVLEDLDSLITDMNRSFFLNEVDGIDGNDGLLLVSLADPFQHLI